MGRHGLKTESQQPRSGNPYERLGTNAIAWAEEFVSAHRGAAIGGANVDRALLLDWFAGAINNGRAAGLRAADALVAERNRLEIALGAAREEVDAAVERAQSWQRWGEQHKQRADAAPNAVAALQVRTGDRVAVLIPEQADEKTLGEFQAELATLFPGVEIIVLAGVTAVLRTGSTAQTARSEDGRT